MRVLFGDTHAHGLQGLLHQVGIAGDQRVIDDRRGVSQRSKDEGAVGHRF